MWASSTLLPPLVCPVNSRHNIVRPLLIKMSKLLGRSVYVNKIERYGNATEAALLLRRWRIVQTGLLRENLVFRNELTLKKVFQSGLWTLGFGVSNTWFQTIAGVCGERGDKWWNNEATADGLHYHLKILYIWTDGPSWGSPQHGHKYNKPV